MQFAVFQRRTHSISKSHNNASSVAFLCISPKTQNNFLPKFPVYIFWLTAFTIVSKHFESIFSTHFRPRVKQNPFDPMLKWKSESWDFLLPFVLAVILKNKPHHLETLEFKTLFHAQTRPDIFANLNLVIWMYGTSHSFITAILSLFFGEIWLKIFKCFSLVWQMSHSWLFHTVSHCGQLTTMFQFVENFLLSYIAGISPYVVLHCDYPCCPLFIDPMFKGPIVHRSCV